MRAFFLIFFILLATHPFSGYAQSMSFNDEYKHQDEPAFEKIYVTPDQLCTFSDGVYYFDDEGNSSKVRATLHDLDGLYVLIVKHQCPLCGKAWSTAEPDDGYGCPIYQRRFHPRIWSY